MSIKTKPYDRREFLTTRKLRLLYLYEKWYGDGCPPWTWPLTGLGVGTATLGAAVLLSRAFQ